VVAEQGDMGGTTRCITAYSLKADFLTSLSYV
jgi:hypothetical protein